MPVYEYHCEKCSGAWETVLPIPERDSPCAAPCPKCKKKKCVRRGVSVCTMGVDATKGPGSDFKALMNKMKRGQPKSTHNALDKAASLRGKKYGAM